MGLDVFYATVSSKDSCLTLLEKILKTHSDTAQKSSRTTTAAVVGNSGRHTGNKHFFLHNMEEFSKQDLDTMWPIN